MRNIASEYLGRLNNLLVHLLDAGRVEKQTEQPAHDRARTLTRAAPGLIVAALVWSLIFVLSIGTNGALAAALERHLTIPTYLVDAFSTLMGERDPVTERDLTALFVPVSAPENEHVKGSGLIPFATGSALASAVVAHVPKKTSDHAGLLDLNSMHELASNRSLNNQSRFVDFSAHPGARRHPNGVSPIGITGPGHAGRGSGAFSDERSHDEQAPGSHVVVAPNAIEADDGQALALLAPASDVENAPYANDPVMDSVPWANSTPNTEPASPQTVHKLVTLEDDLTTLARPPVSLMNDDAPLLDFVRDPRLGDTFAQPAAALAIRVPEPGTMALLVGAFGVWPVVKRVRIGSALRTQSM